MKKLRVGLLVLGAGSLVLVACGGGGGGDGGGETPAAVELLLGVAVYDMAVSGSGSNVTGIDVQIGWEESLSENDLFSITPPLVGSEVGSTYEVIPSSSPSAATFFAKLVDGNDAFLVFRATGTPAGGGSASGYLESLRILERHPSLAGPDLAGATPTRLVLTLTSVHLQAGDPYAFSVTGLISFYGYIP